ncbi:MAG: hypothetical protein IJ251_05875 [Oscillospiraceae bacterium]|nr:hypothetical protein [Oscillospiraceae bacterium]
MNENEKFGRFLSGIKKRSEAKARQILKEAEEESRNILDGAEKAAENAASRHLRDAERLKAGRSVHNMSQIETDVKRAEHAAAERLTGEMFGDIARRLCDYALTDNYKTKLRAAVAAEDTNGGEVHLSPRDVSLVEGAVPDDSISLGGYMIVYRDTGVCINKTYDFALESERESFSSRNIGEGGRQ